MPGSSNPNSGSFIPKRGPSRRRKSKSKNQIFIFSIITYSLLFASLLAAGGTYLYKNYLTSQLQTEVAALNTAVTTFSAADLARVSEFDTTLKRATDRVDNSASIVAILAAIDAATVGPVQIEDLSISRNGDDNFNLLGTIITSSFDGAIFQRKVYNANRNLFTDVSVQEVAITDPETFGLGGSGVEQSVTFMVHLDVPIDQVLYDPTSARLMNRESEIASQNSAPSAPPESLADEAVIDTSI